MAALPLSEAGLQMVAQAEHELARDWPWLQRIIGIDLNLNEHSLQTLRESDWRELAGFAFAHRALESSYAALQRLLIASSLPLTALRIHLQDELPLAECLEHLHLAGRKALLQRWRKETGEALEALDTAACATGREYAEAQHFTEK
jgi:tRNA(Met) cytidine acetyltransferase